MMKKFFKTLTSVSIMFSLTCPAVRFVSADGFTVTYYLNDTTDQILTQEDVESDTYTITKETPEREGYTFVGWAENENADSSAYLPGDTVGVHDNMTLYAVWDDASSVTFDANAGDDQVENMPQDIVIERTEDPEYEIKTDQPTRENYVFIGWGSKKDASSEDVVSSVDFSKKSSYTLYAIWKQESKITVSFDLNASDAIDLPEDISVYKSKKSISLPNTQPSRKGYVFDGWSLKKDAKYGDLPVGSDLTLKGSDMTLYAIWTKKAASKYTVNFYKNDGSDDKTSKTIESKSILMPAVPERKGYTFLGWSYTENNQNEYFTTNERVDINEDTDFYAIWQSRHEINITLDINGGDSGVKKVNKVYEGDTFTLPVPVRKGYTFKYWATNKEDDDTQDDWDYFTDGETSFYSSLTLYAIWEENEHAVITFNANGGKLSDTHEKIIVYPNEGYSFPEPEERKGYTFLYWSLDPYDPGNGKEDVYYSRKDKTYKIDEDMTLYATWALNNKVVFNANGDDVTDMPEEMEIKGNSASLKITSNAPKREGYVFKYWSTLDHEAKKNVLGVETEKASLYRIGKKNKIDPSSIDEHVLQLYAIWEPVTMIVFDGNTDDTVMNLPESITLKKQATTFSTPEQIPVRKGATFLYWSTSKDDKGIRFDSNTKDVYFYTESVKDHKLTLYAVWKEN